MDIFKAMADATRRDILQLLSEKSMNAGEIAEHFQMSKPAISKHLDILKNCEFITCEKKGQFLIYSINTSATQDIVCRFMNVLDSLSNASESKMKHEKK